MEYLRAVREVLSLSEDTPVHYETKVMREEARSKFVPFNTLENQEEILSYKDRFVTPYPFENNSIDCSIKTNTQAIKSIVLVHKIENYRRQEIKFLLLPKVITLLDLILQGGDSDAAILSVKSGKYEEN